MLEYGRIDISKGIDIDKTNASKMWYLLLLLLFVILNISHIFAWLSH